MSNLKVRIIGSIVIILAAMGLVAVGFNNFISYMGFIAAGYLFGSLK